MVEYAMKLLSRQSTLNQVHLAAAKTNSMQNISQNRIDHISSKAKAHGGHSQSNIIEMTRDIDLELPIVDRM